MSDQPLTGRALDDGRLVPVRAERYEGLMALFRATLSDHCWPLVRGGHGYPPVDCPLCTALRFLIAPGAPVVGTEERTYLDEVHPRSTPASPAHDAAGEER